MLKSASNILLAFLLLLLTTGVTITQHFCRDRLQNTDLFVTADSSCETMSCCNTEQEANCTQTHVQKENCCKNERVFIKFLLPFTVIKSAQPVVFVPPFELINILSPQTRYALCNVVFLKKHPPFFKRDILTLFSAFLL